MAAFDPVKSGIPEMDTALDNIRLGDNVVWRVPGLDEFRLFVTPYVEQAIRDNRKLLYIRFASHPPLVDESRPEIEVVHVELSHRFETFTVNIHNIIERAGRDAFYVFDCLSELQTAWSTDLMMGNFFQVTCPYLFILDTVAFFPIIRGKHSFHAIGKIRDTTQLFLDVYSDEEHIFVRPQKVWRRESETMFLPHLYDRETGTFRPVLDGVLSSRFYKALAVGKALSSSENRDSWDRFFDSTMQKYEDGRDVTEECARISSIMMTRDKKLRMLVRKHFRPEDYFAVRERMIGTGMIGGKACGMLLARKIVENRCPDLFLKMEPHDSFYVGSDVFYTFIVENHFWDIRVRQRSEEEYFSLADTFAKHLRRGVFSQTMEEQFVSMLEYYGSDPYIVRSSSILEDGFGNAFAGKYESVFCPNEGTIEERLLELEDAIRTVYASTMSLSALDYRKRRGLDKRDEQMALLIQRVSGSHYGRYYMPCAAGVGYSFNPYRSVGSEDPKAGMLRLVMGLGTSAVDRIEGSYPRIVSLDHPEKSTASSSSERHQFSQRTLEAVDRVKRAVVRLELEDVYNLMPTHLRRALLEHDFDTERMLRERGRARDVMFISCRGLVKRPELMSAMRRMLAAIEAEYEYPVDTEFTINLSPDGEYMISLLQCRPLQVFTDSGQAHIPENIPEENIILECRDASMGLSREEKLDYMVIVDPVGYYNMPYAKKTAVATAIGSINWHFRGKGFKMCLMVPGRVGTSSPELGVPTAFADISEFDMVCEVAESKVGYRPEMSYGSHFFQDLVEADILYTAVFENEKTIHYRPELITEMENVPNSLGEVVPESAELYDIVGLYDLRERNVRLYNDMNVGCVVIADL